jgi:tRNA G46 methylase TrmB
MSLRLVVYRFFEDAHRALAVGGNVTLVTDDIVIWEAATEVLDNMTKLYETAADTGVSSLL